MEVRNETAQVDVPSDVGTDVGTSNTDTDNNRVKVKKRSGIKRDYNSIHKHNACGLPTGRNYIYKNKYYNVIQKY